MHAFSGRFSRTCLEGISFNFFVCFIFNVSLGSAPKRKNFDIQRNTRVASGGQFTLNYHTPSHIRKTFSDLILSSVLGAGIDENVKGFTVNCSCFILFLPRKKFFSNFFLPSLLFLSETFDSKRVNLWHRLTPFSHFVCLEHKYFPDITHF